MADPDIRIGGGGEGEGVFGPQFGLNIRGSGPPWGPSPGSATGMNL